MANIIQNKKLYSISTKLGLLVTIILAFIPLRSFEIEGDINKLLDYRIILPGLFFSLFVLICQFKKQPIILLLIYLFYLMIGYVAYYVIGIFTFGIAVPIVGAIGACQINYVLNGKIHFKDKNTRKFFILGFISSAIGVALYICLAKSVNDGTGFSLMIILWQIVVGVEYIRQLDLKQQSDINGHKSS